MNTRILLPVAVLAILTGCSTAYKSGQTPDDVYYSPGKERAAYVGTNEKKDNGYGDYTDVSDRYLRMKAANRSRWSAFDDDYMYWNDNRWNNPYMFNSWYGGPMTSMSFGYGYGYGGGLGYGHMGYGGYGGYYGYSSYYSNPWFWNNPFGGVYYGNPVIIVNPKPVYRNPVANGPRTYNLNTYSNAGRRGYNPEYTGRQYNPRYSGSNAPVRVFNNTGSSNNPGRGGRYINTNSSSSGRSNNYNPRNNDSRSSNPVRTFDNNNSGGRSSGSSSGSSGSSSGSSAPVRSFPRGGR